jgi:hypothetical protein
MSPNNTAPKLMPLGFATSWPGATPVPDSDSVSVPSEALLDIEIVPLTLLAAEGIKTTFKVALWPPETVSGRLGALRENSAVLALAPVIVTEAAPRFVAVTVSVLLLRLQPCRNSVSNCLTPGQRSTLVVDLQSGLRLSLDIRPN